MHYHQTETKLSVRKAIGPFRHFAKAVQYFIFTNFILVFIKRKGMHFPSAAFT